MRIKSLIISIFLSVFIKFNFLSAQIMQPQYFNSIEESIPLIKKLLNDNDWNTLACYYNLSNFNNEHDDLISGDFFIRKNKPEVSHPGNFWEYKNPFHPDFNYLSCSEIENNIFKIEMIIEIDQGDGIIQFGKQYFFLIKNEFGFQILPEYDF